MGISGSAGQSSGVVKWKLETLKHISNRRTTGAQLCLPVRGLSLLPQLELALQKFTSEDFLLRNGQSNLPSHPNIGSRRDPGLASEEVLASIQFLQINISQLFVQPISFLRT